MDSLVLLAAILKKLFQLKTVQDNLYSRRLKIINHRFGLFN